MSNTNSVEKNNDTKKITALIILIVTVMVTTTSATYAFFQFSASSNNTLTGTAATASIAFASAPTTPIAPNVTSYQAKPMVPQKSLNGTTNVLQKAVTGVKPAGESNVIPCVDGNGNAVCRVYSFTIQNNSTATAVIKGQIQFAWGANNSAANWFENLKWKLMTSATAVTVSSSDAAKSATKAWQDFATGLSLAPNATKQYWIVIWIEEIGSNQNNTDKGTWTASIQFINNVDGTGITSTITS